MTAFAKLQRRLAFKTRLENAIEKAKNAGNDWRPLQSLKDELRLNILRRNFPRYNENFNTIVRQFNELRRPLAPPLPTFLPPLPPPLPLSQPPSFGIPMEDWGAYVRVRIGDNAFNLTIKSSIVLGVETTFSFSNIHHFNNWMKSILDQAIVSSSSELVEYRNSVLRDGDIYGHSTLVISPVAGGCNRTRAGVTTTDKTIKTSFNTYKCYNPVSIGNNCGFACISKILGLNLNYADLRREFKLEQDTEVSIEILTQVYNKHNTTEKFLVVLDKDFVWSLDFSLCDYIFHKQGKCGGHFLVIESVTNKPETKKKYKRSLLAFDFETRNVNKDTHKTPVGASNYKYDISDTICSIHYETLKRENCNVKTNTKTFTTGKINSSRQFLDFLTEEHRRNRHYICLAHNGARFDFILLQKMMTKTELLHAEFQYRGLSIISMDFNGHIFRDPCCFMPNSLENLCNNFKVEVKKLTEFKLRDETLTNKNLVFYRPDLTLKEFMELERNQPEFWDLYVKYCEFDCISLLELWKKFKDAIETLIKRVGSYKKGNTIVEGDWLLKKCSLISKTTIGGLAKKVVTEINKSDRFKHLANYESFYKVDNKVCPDKYNFVCKFKRGGISHCNQAGEHVESISGIDVTSQYPEAMVNMKVPSGKSWFTDKYDNRLYGYYHLTNLKWNTPYKLKPVCPSTDKVLNWNAEWSATDTVYMDSEMLKYCIAKYGLVSFDVINGLVSSSFVKGSVFFGKYVDTLFQGKAEQDVFKETNDPRYNNALREVIKLMLNSMSGKLVEDPSKYFQLNYTSLPYDKRDNINGVGFNKTSEFKPNLWVGCGVMVYSHSKRLLFDYIECMPEKADSVVHIETDGIYFHTKDMKQFKANLGNYKGDFPCKLGNGLGNIKVEHASTTGSSYFLGKKFYYMFDRQDIMRIKGIRQTTIDKYGNDVRIVTKQLYEDVYNWKPEYENNNVNGKVTNYITRTFSTLVKSVFGNIGISSMEMTRTIKPNMVYKRYA